MEIYYYTYQIYNSEYYNQITRHENINMDILKKYYVKVYYIDDVLVNSKNENIKNILEEYFALFNSEENPLTDKQNEIIQWNTHTSMNVGDIIKIGNIYYMVSYMGFNQLKIS